MRINAVIENLNKKLIKYRFIMSILVSTKKNQVTFIFIYVKPSYLILFF